MPKKIEQLYVEDLKVAFRIYLDARDHAERPSQDDSLRERNQRHREEWAKFWSVLRRKCSVVEGL